MKIQTLIILMLLLSISSFAQTILTPDQAVEITLANNFGIQIAKNNVIVAQNNTDKRANGYLPTVTASAGANGNLGGSTQKFNTGQEVKVSNALTLSANADINANYTLFDKKRSITMQQLKERVGLGNLQLQQTIENNLLQVYNAYYNVVQLIQNKNVLEETIIISNERLRRAQYALDYGQGDGLAVLNAQVDIQRDSINLINRDQEIITAKRNLNTIMGRDAATPFNVIENIDYASSLDYKNLLADAKENNINLQVNRQNQVVSRIDVELIDAENMPTISTGASYSYSLADNPDNSFITGSSSRGLAANVGVNWNIFDASRKVRRQNAIIAIQNQQLQEAELNQQIERDVSNAWDNFQNTLRLLRVEQQSLKIAQENFDRTQEQVRLGRLSSIEFRQAQLNLLNAQVGVNQAVYTAKLRELELLQLAGQL